MALFPRTAFLALVFATALVSVGTSASGATACSGPAPIPYGNLLGKVERVDAASNARIGFSNPKAMAFKVLTSTRRASTTKLLVNVDDLRSAERVLVTLRTAGCFGSEPIAAPSSVQGVAPPGYAFAEGIKDAAKLPTFTVISSIRAAKGSPAYLFDNAGRSIGFATVDGSNGK